jgi:hypothetical protein
MECSFCKKQLSTKNYLEIHQDKCRYNLKNKKEVLNKESNECIHCKKIYSTSFNLNRHLTICEYANDFNTKDLLKQIKILKKVEKECKNKDQEILILKEELKNQEKLKYIEKQYYKLQEEFIDLQKSYQKLVENNIDNAHSFEKLASKAIDKAGNKTYNNKIIQNLVPLSNEYIKEQAKFLELKHIVDGPDSLALFAKDYSFNERVICTDVARRNFIFKDENGSIIKDPKGVKVTKMFIQNNKDELIRLLKQYLLTFYDDDSTMNLDEKQDVENMLLAIKYNNDVETVESYNKFEKQFTICFSKLVYNKQFDDE